jgi:hypothetical protein
MQKNEIEQQVTSRLAVEAAGTMGLHCLETRHSPSAVDGWEQRKGRHPGRGRDSYMHTRGGK